MHVGVVFSGVPNPGHGGGSLTAWSFVRSLLDAGHRVTTFAVMGTEPEPRLEERVRELELIGSAVVPIPSPGLRAPGRFEGLIDPSDELLFPSVTQAPLVRATAREAGIDAALVYTTEAVAAATQLSVPMVGLMSDPPGLSRSLRRRYEPLPWGPDPRRTVVRLREKAYVRKVDGRLLELLRRFPSVGMFGAHHAEWARSHGVAAWYAPSPIVDLGGADWKQRRADTPRAERPRILMIGHLRGIATISGLQIFAESILPVLTHELGPDGFEVHVVGGYDPPAAAGNAFDHPAVLRRGQIEPPDDEFLAADVLLVPTPLRTGPRSRIITGMTFGTCVVAHEANRLGIPELRHGENTFLAADGPGLARATLDALADPAARARVGREARRLYETTFAPSIAGARITRELERVAAEAGRPAVAAR
jgi:glycosyltransferase involved in cell wall biosynthesis